MKRKKKKDLIKLSKFKLFKIFIFKVFDRIHQNPREPKDLRKKVLFAYLFTNNEQLEKNIKLNIRVKNKIS